MIDISWYTKFEPPDVIVKLTFLYDDIFSDTVMGPEPDVRTFPFADTAKGPEFSIDIFHMGYIFRPEEFWGRYRISCSSGIWEVTITSGRPGVDTPGDIFPTMLCIGTSTSNTRIGNRSRILNFMLFL